jgi:sialic acid synthase SpsE
MPLKSVVHFGAVPVGPGHPPVLMPEIGTYFTTDQAIARETILAVAAAGARIIKGEVFLSPDVVWDKDFEYAYQTAHGRRVERYRDIVARRVMPVRVWLEIYGVCREAGLPFVISTYDLESVEFCAEVKAAGIKIASNNLVHVPLLRHAAKTGIPVVIDTGKASFDEVKRAVDELQGHGCDRVIINHNPDGHPAPAADHNLRIIETYRHHFGCPIGLADHYPGIEMLFVAIGCGYDLLEKPITHDLTLDDVDVPWAIHRDDLATLAAKVNDAAIALGETRRTKSYAASDHPARMCLVARRDLAKGAAISLDNVRFAWPCRGISVAEWDRVAGQRLAETVPADQPIQWSHLGHGDHV